MKQVIEGRVYNTETATRLCVAKSQVAFPGDFRYWEGVLYQTKNGRFFLDGFGGPMTRWARPDGASGASGGSGIVPIDEQEALSLAERIMAPDELARWFTLEDA